jgi:hypothetical protein
MRRHITLVKFINIVFFINCKMKNVKTTQSSSYLGSFHVFRFVSSRSIAAIARPNKKLTQSFVLLVTFSRELSNPLEKASCHVHPGNPTLIGTRKLDVIT